MLHAYWCTMPSCSRRFPDLLVYCLCVSHCTCSGLCQCQMCNGICLCSGESRLVSALLNEHNDLPLYPATKGLWL